MATRKKAQPQTKPPDEMTAEQVAALAAIKAEEEKKPEPPPLLPVPHMPEGMYMYPDQDLVYVDCPIPGWQHLSVGFQTANEWRALHGPIFNGDGNGSLRKIMLLARDFKGWNLWDEGLAAPVPKPTPPEVESYEPFYGPALELGVWCVSVGYITAKRQALGLDFPETSKPT